MPTEEGEPFRAEPFLIDARLSRQPPPAGRTPPGPGDVVTAPTAVAVSRTCSFPRANRPREWAERLYNVRRWSVMPRGGHFAPAEEPQLVARDLAAFFATLGR